MERKRASAFLTVFVMVMSIPATAYAAGPGLYYTTYDASAFWYDEVADQSVPVFDFPAELSYLAVDQGSVFAISQDVASWVGRYDIATNSYCEAPISGVSDGVIHNGSAWFATGNGTVSMSLDCQMFSSPIPAGWHIWGVVRGVNSNGDPRLFMADYMEGNIGDFDPVTEVYTPHSIGLTMQDEVWDLAFHEGTGKVYFTTTTGVSFTDVATWSSATYFHNVGAEVKELELFGNTLIYNEHNGPVYITNVYSGQTISFPVTANRFTVGRTSAGVTIFVRGWGLSGFGIYVYDTQGNELSNSPIVTVVLEYELGDLVFAHPQSVHGDGLQDYDESCDGTDLDGLDCTHFGFPGGTLACAADCKSFDTTACITEICGNGTREGDEECDNGVANSNTQPDACRADCTLPGCGDEVIDTGEDCDSIATFTTTCQELPSYDTGTLACNVVTCEFDTSSCSSWSCGNDVREGEEQCDGEDLNDTSCEDRGFSAGTLACTNQCAFDESGCESIQPDECGNDVREGIEECDGDDLSEATCVSLDLGGGTLGCTEHCVYDTSGCDNQPVCGNNTRDPGEECDGTDLPVTCQNLGFDTGIPSCTDQCKVDASSCFGNSNNNNGNTNGGANNSGGCAEAGTANGLPILLLGILFLLITAVRRRKTVVLLQRMRKR